MKEFKGTPGPWFAEDDYWSKSEDAIVTSDYRSEGSMIPVAKVIGGGSESGFHGEFSKEQHHNAKLIAAAPELLDALQYINHAINHGTQMDIVNGQEMAESAINKALGE